MVVRIPVGDRSWTVTCVATHTFRSAEVFTKAHWSVLLGGILFTALLTFYLVRSRRELENRIQLTQTIYEREELFRQLAETVDVVFWATNAAATRLEYIGPAFRQIAGREARLDSASPSLMLDVFEADDRRTLVAAIGQLQTEGARFTVVLPVTRASQGGTLAARLRFPGARAGLRLEPHRWFSRGHYRSQAGRRCATRFGSQVAYPVQPFAGPDLYRRRRSQYPAHQPTLALSGRRRRREAIGADSPAGCAW
jgi:hypothetical protein